MFQVLNNETGNDSFNRVMVPDIEDLRHLGGKLGWLLLFYDEVLIPDFENIFQRHTSHGSYGRVYGCYREALESGWQARPTPTHLGRPYEYINEELKSLIDERVVRFVPFDRRRDLVSIATLRTIYGRMMTVNNSEWSPEEEKWHPIINHQAHTIGKVTFSKEGDIMFAAIEAEGKDLQQQVLIRCKADELGIPIASAQNSHFLVPVVDRVEDVPSNRIATITAELVTQLNVAFPSFTNLPYDEWLEARDKYQDLLTPARRHLRRLAFTFAKDFRHDNQAEVNAWAAAYVKNVISSDVEAVQHAIGRDHSKIGRQILGAIIDFIPVLFGVLDWKKILVDGMKSSLKVRDAFDSKKTETPEVADRAAFIKLLAKANKR